MIRAEKEIQVLKEVEDTAEVVQGDDEKWNTQPQSPTETQRDLVKFINETLSSNEKGYHETSFAEAEEGENDLLCSDIDPMWSSTLEGGEHEHFEKDLLLQASSVFPRKEFLRDKFVNDLYRDSPVILKQPPQDSCLDEFVISSNGQVAEDRSASESVAGTSVIEFTYNELVAHLVSKAVVVREEEVEQTGLSPVVNDHREKAVRERPCPQDNSHSPSVSTTCDPKDKPPDAFPTCASTSKEGQRKRPYQPNNIPSAVAKYNPEEDSVDVVDGTTYPVVLSFHGKSVTYHCPTTEATVNAGILKQNIDKSGLLKLLGVTHDDSYSLYSKEKSRVFRSDEDIEITMGLQLEVTELPCPSKKRKFEVQKKKKEERVVKGHNAVPYCNDWRTSAN